MCGNDGFFHGKFLSPKFGKRPRKGPSDEERAESERIRIEQEAAIAANIQRRKRVRGSLFGYRSALGARAGGAPAGAGAGMGGAGVGGGGAGRTRRGGGSALGSIGGGTYAP